MSEAVDDMVDGITCQVCGAFFDDYIEGKEPPGYPRTCDCCKDGDE